MVLATVTITLPRVWEEERLLLHPGSAIQINECLVPGSAIRDSSFKKKLEAHTDETARDDRLYVTISIIQQGYNLMHNVINFLIQKKKIKGTKKHWARQNASEVKATYPAKIQRKNNSDTSLIPSLRWQLNGKDTWNTMDLVWPNDR